MATTNLLTTASSAVTVCDDEPTKQRSYEVIHITDRKVKYINTTHEKTDFKLNDKKSDVTIKVDNAMFNAHRKILEKGSETLKLKLSKEMVDENGFKPETSSLSGVRAMLDYFYEGHVILDEKVVPEILAVGQEFKLQWILDICEDYLIKYLSAREYSLTLQLSQQYHVGDDVRGKIAKYFGEHFRSCIEKGGFYTTTCFEFLDNFLESGMFVDVSEYLLMQVILKWVGSDKTSRKDKLETLLRKIRFPLMTPEELKGISKPVTEYADIKLEIQEAINYQTNIPAQCLKTGTKYLSRGSRPTVIFCTFGADDSVVIYKEPVDEEENLFVERLGPSGVFEDYSTTNQTVLGNFLYAAGGFKEELKTSSSMYRYDPRDRKWIPIVTMSQPRASFAMCSSRDRIYVIGGVYHDVENDGEEIILKSVEVYNPELNGWEKISDLPYGMFDTASAYCNGKLYVSGGISEQSVVLAPQKSMFSFELKQDKWSPSSDMLYPRQGHSMSALGKSIYVLGGYTAQEDKPRLRNCYACEVFDTVTGQWTEIASTPAKFGHLFRHVGIHDNKIYFLCTEDSEVFSACYDTVKKQFSEFVKVELGVCKVSVLSVGYPHPW